MFDKSFFTFNEVFPYLGAESSLLFHKSAKDLLQNRDLKLLGFKSNVVISPMDFMRKDEEVKKHFLNMTSLLPGAFLSLLVVNKVYMDCPKGLFHVILPEGCHTFIVDKYIAGFVCAALPYNTMVYGRERKMVYVSSFSSPSYL